MGRNLPTFPIWRNFEFVSVFASVIEIHRNLVGFIILLTGIFRTELQRLALEILNAGVVKSLYSKVNVNSASDYKNM